MSAAPKLTDDEIERIADAIARRLAAPAKPRQTPPVLITEILQKSAKKEIARLGLDRPRRKR